MKDWTVDICTVGGGSIFIDFSEWKPPKLLSFKIFNSKRLSCNCDSLKSDKNDSFIASTLGPNTRISVYKYKRRRPIPAAARDQNDPFIYGEEENVPSEGLCRTQPANQERL